MNILDENIIASQRQRLRSWRIPVRQIDVDIARKGFQDEEILPFLHHLRQPTFFTRDRGFYRREVCHRQGLKAFIMGAIAPIGSHYAITLTAVDSESGGTLAVHYLGRAVVASPRTVVVEERLALEYTFFDPTDSSRSPVWQFYLVDEGSNTFGVSRGFTLDQRIHDHNNPRFLGTLITEVCNSMLGSPIFKASEFRTHA